MEQLDPQAVNLAKAIRQTESGGNFKAEGKSGEHGAYQFTEPTWNNYASQYGIKTALRDSTPEQQNEVAYKKIKEWKDQGRNVGEIASMWNAGEGRANAYLEGNSGTNSKGVHYDTAAYAKKVAEAYQQFKGQGGGQPQESQPAQSQAPQQDQYSGALGTNPNDSLYGKLIDNSVTRGVQSLFPGKEVGQAIGTLGGYLASSNKKFYDTSAPSPLQVLGDIGQGALTVALPEAGEGAGLLARLGVQGAVGAGLGATGAIANGSTDIGDIAKQTAIGGAVGTAAGGLGEIVGGLSKYIPSKMIQGKFEGLTDAEAQKFLDQGIGTKNGLYKGAQDVVGEEGNKIDAALKARDAANSGSDRALSEAETQRLAKQNSKAVKPAGPLPGGGTDLTATLGGDTKTAADRLGGVPEQSSKLPQPVPTQSPLDPIQQTIEQFPEYKGKEPKLVQKIKSFVANNASMGPDMDRKKILEYIDKIANGEASLYEKNQVKKVLDKAVTGGYTKLAKAISPNAGHDLVITFTDALRDEIKSQAPETVPMFDEIQKSINIRNAAKKVALKKGSSGLIRYSDIIPFLGGTAAGGPIGGIGGVALDRAVENPAIRFASAKAVRSLGGAAKVGIKASTGLLPAFLKREKDRK